MESEFNQGQIENSSGIKPESNIEMQTGTTSSQTDLSHQIPAKNKPLKKSLAFLLLLLIAIGVASGAYFLMSKAGTQVPSDTSQSQPTPFTFKAKVEYLTGSAFKIIDGRKTEIFENDILSEGDVIETEKSTRLVISFDEGSILRIDEESKITLSMLTSPLSTVTQESGNVFYRVSKDEAHKFEVVAGDVKVESLGTAYSVENEADVKVKVFENKVKVLAQNTEKEVEQNQEWEEKTNEVTQIDQKELATSEFYSWSLNEEGLKPTSTPKPTQAPSTNTGTTASGIKLEAFQKTDSIKLEWGVAENLDVSKGFKAVYNKTGSPVFPGDQYKYLTEASARGAVLPLTDGATYYIRVCQYLGGGCGVYSNEVTIKAPSVSKDGTTTSSVTSITLSTSKVEEHAAKLTWTVEGTSSKGYKVLWSENQNPTYPTRDGDWFVYLTDTGSRNYTIGELSSGKTYYFRVCEYLGGTCGTYSNQTSISY